MKDFQQLDVLRKAHGLVLRVYTASKDLPARENFGLILHLRRSVVAVARGIAEGCGRASDADFAIDFKKKARAAGHELEYPLLLSHDLGFPAVDLHDDLKEQLLEVRKMISVLPRSLHS